jgi:phosphoribosylamine--glycine ligase
MKVLVIGAGGREHALVRSITRSRRVSQVVCAPGNAGIAQLARCIPVSQKDLDDLLRVAASESPDLVVVGPELPLSLGLVDELQRRSIPVFGPTQKAAQLESSKAFAKRFMQRHKIPTAAYAVATSQQQALESIDLFHLPLVIKADGLASGKGVLICETRREATEAISGLMAGKLLGSAQSSIVIEEFLSGEEISFLTLTDGKHVVPLAPAQDHKRIGEGDKGPNTGGMGAYSTDRMVDEQMREWIINHIALPTVNGMAAEVSAFVGGLYGGAGVQCPIWRSRDPGHSRPAGLRPGGYARRLRRGPSERYRAPLEARCLRLRHCRLGRLPRQLRNRTQDQRLGRGRPCPRSRDLSFGHRPGRRTLRHRGRKSARSDRSGSDPGTVALPYL